MNQTTARPQLHSRRDFIKRSALAATLIMSLPANAIAADILWSALNNESRYPVSATAWRNHLARNTVAYDGLVTCLKSENHYECDIRGNLPADLSGTLLRNGPGLFERGEMRRRMQIDGDGMVRRFQIKDGKVTFTNRHIRTEKFKNEEKAGRYIYPSFAMLVPKYGSIFTNSVTKVKNQASVTTFTFGGRVFATDEIQALVELHPRTLQTLGEVQLIPGRDLKFMAHYRITHFGAPRLHLMSFDPLSKKAQVHTFNEQFQVVARSQEVKIDRSFHDWHVTPDYFIFLLPPLEMSSLGLAKAVAGLATVADSIQFNTNEKAQILILPRDNRPPKFVNLPHTLDSWHSVNAYQQNSQIIFDFVASRTRGDIASNRSVWTRIMRGEIQQNRSLRATTVDRAVLDYTNSRHDYHHNYYRLEGVEMPTVNQTRIGKRNEFAYFIRGQEAIDSQIAKLNLQNGQKEYYDFGPNKFVTEPIYAPSSEHPDRGYLLTEVYSHQDRKSYLAVFNAENISAGPVAEVWLRHHLPLGFHGYWVAG